MSDTTYAQSNKLPVQRTTLLFTDAAGQNQNFQLFVVSETHEISAMVTEHPVEEGANITDHVRPNLANLSLDCFVTQSPSDAAGVTRQQATANLPQYPTIVTLNGISPPLAGPPQMTTLIDEVDLPGDYVREAMSLFTQLRDEATLIEIIMPRAYYPSMLLHRIQMRRDKSSGTGAYFTLEFKELRIVRASLTAAPTDGDPAAQPETSKGNVAPNTPKESVAFAAKQAATNLLSSLTGH